MDISQRAQARSTAVFIEDNLMQPVRAGLFGLTHPHSEAHFKTLQASSLVDEIILYDADPSVLNSLNSTDKVAGAYSDLSVLLGSKKIAFGIACARNDQNPDLCLRLFEQGIHVISRKTHWCFGCRCFSGRGWRGKSGCPTGRHVSESLSSRRL